MGNLDIKSKTVYFSTSAQIVKRFGRESVSDPIIAILELVKNSYDADANYCKILFENIRTKEKGKIIIRDDGTGMSEEDINKKWLRAATNNKSIEKITRKFKRRKIGEKGIGRFATERLGSKVSLISKPNKSDTGCILELNWSDYDDPDADFEKIPLKLNFFKKEKEDHGLEIIIENLDGVWNEDKIENLKTELSLILPPNLGKGKFTAEIETNEFPKASGKIKSSFLNDADFIFNGCLERNGTITYKLKTRYGKKIQKGDKLKEFLCGPVEFQLFFFYLGKTEFLSKKDNEKIDFSLRKKILTQFSGIKLYRDGFRVKPFGDPSNDWLDINRERINNPSLYPGNKQLFGIVKITKDQNPSIEDTTSRENIVVNMAWEDLKKFIKGSIRFFILERQKLEKKYKGKKGTVKRERNNLIKQSFKDIKKESIEEPKMESIKVPTIPQDIILECPKPVRRTLEEFNGCLNFDYYNAAAVLARKALEISSVLKFKQENKENLIIKDSEYIELNKRIEMLKNNKMISSHLAKKLIEDNKIKLFGDSAAHSFMINVRPEDISPIRDMLRLCMEELFSNKE